MRLAHRFGLAAFTVALAATLMGCGTPGAPMAPSLNLADRVTGLAAVRIGNQVQLRWIMPRKNTDKLLLKGNVLVHVCRQQGSGACEQAGADIELAPGSTAAFTDALPAALASGEPRVASYFVELKNRNGRSAGLSNAAIVLAGEAPAPITGLTAEMRKAGVVLRWNADAGSAAVRLHRKLLTPPAQKQQEGLLTSPPEPLEQSLLVEAAAHSDHALDKEIRFGQTYEYRAQRVARVSVDGRMLELAGELSAPVRIEAQDIFPPAVPTRLAAVATAAENGAEPAIDLSWQPVTDTDLAGYVVYRREGDATWVRISPATLLVGPAFHDAHVLAGHTYRYAVSAIDQGGHESSRSSEAEESVLNP